MTKSPSNPFLECDKLLERTIKLAEKLGVALGIIDLIRMTINYETRTDEEKIKEIRRILAQFLPKLYN